jgi:glycosyltransferase involved in cell wall biosynthesis
VASNVGGIGEAVVHDRTGLLVPPRDPAALAAALRRLLEDAALRRRLGAAGRDRALGHFTSEHMLTKTAALYDRVLSGAAAGG